MITIGTISSSDKSVPNAPTIGTATNVGSGRAFNNGRGDVTFTAPVYTGRLPITGYTVTSSPGGFTGTGSTSPITVTGLQSSTSYTFTVTGTNSVGSSVASAASNSITATTVPQAPTIGTATDGGTGTTVSVAFTPGANGGSTVTGYTATSSPGGFTGTGSASPITVSGLTAGTAYTFTVTGTNANGTSAASAASNSVTPAIPGAFESIATATPTSGTSVVFSNIPQGYKHLQVRMTGRASANSEYQIRLNGDSGSNYAWNRLYGDNNGPNAAAVASATHVITGNAQSDASEAGYMIVDVAEYSSTTKTKTITSFYGWNAGSTNFRIGQFSGMWNNTAAVTSVTIVITSGANFVSGNSIALYGIKG